MSGKTLSFLPTVHLTTANDIVKIIIISSAKPRSSQEAALNEPRSGQISLTSSQHDNDTVSCPRDDSLCGVSEKTD
ncbi:hypothetical protein Q8A67_021590 [Cirrhinus molitorella]|uniref:Uncharacterized protein n=1 Tax=Cirrhinus molitorella TaxID=172907 RepID=A0AA88TG81_9TELE|nr:hypothetical protein Q8A67_021590 [Cirrhinus molitorella]